MDGGDDWFAFKGSENPWGGFLCGDVDARASVLSVSPLRVCYYLKPASHVSCPQGTEFGDDPVPGNYAGCCASNATSVTFGSNNADVLVKVSSPAANACFPYTLQYNY
ncbi:MAG TPA: hypothetical protein VFS00_11785 [Polyangiaceae bacterium]|nr:hypothetical protein [Polyangiaceae bacterium]